MASIQASTSSRLDTSTVWLKISAEGEAERIAATAESSASARMSLSDRVAPRAASRWAVASPIPEAAPVMVMVFPEREVILRGVAGCRVPGAGLRGAGCGVDGGGKSNQRQGRPDEKTMKERLLVVVIVRSNRKDCVNINTNLPENPP